MDDEIISEFLVESYEGLDRMEQNFVVLEETPDDISTLTEVFRILHTIKGTCGFLGFGQLEKVAHRGENLLSLLRDAVLEVDHEITDALLATADTIREMLADIESSGEEGERDTTALVARLEELSARADTTARAPAVEDDAHEATEDAAAEPEDAAPDEATAEPHGGAPDEAAADLDDPAEPRLGDLLVEDGAAERTDVEIAAVEQGLGDDRRIGSILVDEGRAQRDEVEKAAAKQRSASESTIRVDVAVLDSLKNLVGELVLSRNQIVQLASSSGNQDFVTPAQRLNLVTSELQEGVMKTRMQPIGAIWSKFPRVVRDLAQQFDKQIRLEMTGKDTELDRTILEAIKDPLTHMVRNTADHGIEDPETRVASGKPAEGLLRLTASHEGGQVNIEIADDGAGIDAGFMRTKAVDKGLITADEAARMSDADAVRLIFRPGFSTAAQVSNVSGRGVGMDVVRTNIERIGGSVDIQTATGKGTTFKVTIPLTLAIVPAIIVTCDDNRYAIPQVSLQELVRLDESQRIEDMHGAPVYRLRDRLLPMVDLREQLGLETVDRSDGANVVVLQADGNPFGLIVDTIEDTEEIVVKPLGRSVKDVSYFSGATIMGDGAVALILDVLGLAAESKILKPGQDAADASAANEAAHAVTDMLDDRTMLMVGFVDANPVAIRLDQVERLEEFPLAAIEESDHRSVVQYRGEIMQLVDLGPASGHGRESIGTSDTVSVVVCSVEGVAIGLAVARIMDIVSQPEIHADPSGRGETAIIDGQVVDVVDATSLIRRHVALPEPTGESMETMV